MGEGWGSIPHTSRIFFSFFAYLQNTHFGIHLINWYVEKQWRYNSHAPKKVDKNPDEFSLDAFYPKPIPCYQTAPGLKQQGYRKDHG